MATNLIKKRFWRLKVVWKWGKPWYWKCVCDCWKFVERSAWHLLDWERKWIEQSCGCARRTAHMMCGTKFYHKYQSIKLRCENPKCESYKNYGLRWIKCDRKTFWEFYKDMFDSYKRHSSLYGEENTTIDRLDNNLNYCKENCRWAAPKEQANNRRNNRFITYMGITQSLSMWADTLWISYPSLYNKLRRGVPFEFIAKNPSKRYYIEKELRKYV